MEEPLIEYHSENIDFQLNNETNTSEWIIASIESEGESLSHINFIFCDDNYLHAMNVEYLDHDTLTDVITFPYADSPIEGDIFISIDRINSNATELGISPIAELNRVMIHGVLHLLGYEDKSPEDKALMTEKEDFYLARLN